MTHIEKFCRFILKQIEIYDDDMEESFHPAEVIAVLEMVKLELIAGTLAASGFHVWSEEGLSKKEADQLLGQEDPLDIEIEEPDDEDAEED